MQNVANTLEVNWGPLSVVSCDEMPMSIINHFNKSVTFVVEVLRPHFPTKGRSDSLFDRIRYLKPAI